MFDDQESDAISDASTDFPGAKRGPGDTVTTGPAIPASEKGEASSARPASPTDAIVDEWFAKHFHGLGAKLDEPLFNHLRAAKEDLKSILAGVHQ